MESTKEIATAGALFSIFATSTVATGESVKAKTFTNRLDRQYSVAA